MPFGCHLTHSPWNGEPVNPKSKTEWTVDAADVALSVIATRDHNAVESIFGDALLTVSGCVRPSFVAAPGHDLIGSDYSAIEAVCIAALSRCTWRLESFARREDIYLASIARSKHISLQFYLDHKAQHGVHHPDRKYGKIQELALGYGGWIGALLAFGADGDEDTLKQQIIAWRNASPEIVELWGGQGRGWPGRHDYRAELFGLEGAAVYAIQNPREVANLNGVKLYMRNGALIMRLLSGRELTYHNPVLLPSDRRAGELKIVYETWNSNPKMGPPGWVRMETYGGRLAENLTQATAHDIQRYGIVNLMKAGYFVVLHVYDEDVAEVPKGFGSVEEFERIMSTMPPWAENWPIRAAGGWRGRRYRKD
jgi:DNA polymerase